MTQGHGASQTNVAIEGDRRVEPNTNVLRTADQRGSNRASCHMSFSYGNAIELYLAFDMLGLCLSDARL